MGAVSPRGGERPPETRARTSHISPLASVVWVMPRSRFRRTLVRVLVIQAVTLALLWLLQARYAG